jgi:hypothetical protein
LFREHLGIPLVTVEWSPDGRFDLGPRDADVMIRVQGGDLMWQKERLLNRGLAHIRRQGMAGDVAVVDADVVFEQADWHYRVVHELAATPIVQCHAHIAYLPDLPAGLPGRAQLVRVPPEHAMPSLGYAMAQGRPLFATDAATAHVMAVAAESPSSGNAGMAVALRLAGLPGFEFYDANIVGGGDLLLASAWLDELEAFFAPRQYTAAHRADVLHWARRCLPARRKRQLGWADNRVLHLWHGTLAQRQYGERRAILGSRGFDPARHIDRSGEALRFTGAAGEIKAAVEAYLVSRNDA